MKKLVLMILMLPLPALASPASGQLIVQQPAAPMSCIDQDRDGASPHHKKCVHILY